jgi:hypothetical protein
MSGRGYAFQGDSLASAFIAGEFRRSGLQWFASDYFQEFRIPVNIFPGEIGIKLNNEVLKPGIDFLIDPASPPVHGNFPVIRINPGDFMSTEKIKKISTRSKGKVICINRSGIAGMPDSIQKAAAHQMEEWISGVLGRPAALLINADSKLTWSTAVSVRNIPVIHTKGIDLKKVHRIRLNIDSEFIPEYPTRNVIAQISSRPRDDSMIVITAHYDHLGRMGRDTYFPGANDNASGTALMLDLARTFSRIRDSLRTNLVFIAFTGEEAGLLGSQYFTGHPVFPLGKIKFLINLDLAGTGDDGITVVNGTKFKYEFELLTKINAGLELLPAVNSRGEACNSDHCPFHRQGVPCFFIYTLGGIQAYHDIYDRPDTLPLTRYKEYFLLLEKFILTLARK